MVPGGPSASTCANPFSLRIPIPVRKPTRWPAINTRLTAGAIDPRIRTLPLVRISFFGFGPLGSFPTIQPVPPPVMQSGAWPGLPGVPRPPHDEDEADDGQTPEKDKGQPAHPTRPIPPRCHHPGSGPRGAFADGDSDPLHDLGHVDILAETRVALPFTATTSRGPLWPPRRPAEQPAGSSPSA